MSIREAIKLSVVSILPSGFLSGRYDEIRGVGPAMSVPRLAAESGKPTFISSCANHLLVISSFLRQAVNCGFRSSSGKHERSASLALWYGKKRPV